MFVFVNTIKEIETEKGFALYLANTITNTIYTFDTLYILRYYVHSVHICMFTFSINI